MDGVQDKSRVDRHRAARLGTRRVSSRSLFRRKQVSFLVLFSLVFFHHASASSRSSSHRRSSQPHRKRRKRHRPQETDPHDVSSSSPSFLPVAFSDDEQEEHILSALARLELEDDEEEEEQPFPRRVERKKQQTTKLVRTSVEGKDTEQDVVVQPRGEQNGRQALHADPATSVKAVRETMPTPLKETPAPPSVQPSLNTLETMDRSLPRQNLAPTSLERPRYTAATQAWTRPLVQQQQTATPQPRVTPPERRSMPTSGAITPQPAYPPHSGFPRPSRQDVNLSTTRWARNFLASRPKDTLLPIPREYLSDGFNLVQLAPIVERIGSLENGYVSPSVQSESYPLFKAALRLILQQDCEQSSTTVYVQRAAEVLYTLVHARYAMSPRGLDTVRRVLRRSDGTVDPVFGRCPRMRCRGMPLLPYGDSDNYDPRNSVTTRAKRYCPCCGEKLYMWDSKADESAWGPSFCHLFLMLYGNIVFPDLQRTVNTHNGTMAEPCIFGFKLHPASQLRYVPG